MRQLGFTLAEVLITLGIIGVVAAMTIPTVLQNAQSQQTVSALKKAYSELSQAYTLSVQDNGTPDNWSLVAASSDDGAAEMINKLAPYLKSINNCGKNGGCWPNLIYKNLDNTTNWGNLSLANSGSATAQLPDGSLLASWSYGSCSWAVGSGLLLSKACGQYFIDVNGNKSPNRFGVDVFMFWLTPSGILPAGTANETVYDFPKCLDHTNGRSCAAWVLYNENMDYLKCNTLSWSGPTKCN